MAVNKNLVCDWNKVNGEAIISVAKGPATGQPIAKIRDLIAENTTMLGRLTGAKPDDYIGTATMLPDGNKKMQAGVFTVSSDKIGCSIPEAGIMAIGPKPTGP